MRPAVLDRRRAGVLLHPTSLPGGVENGDLGPDAYRFVEFVAACGLSVWQTLPLGPTHADRSPYACLSVHAGNPRLISLASEELHGWAQAGAPEEGGRRAQLAAARRGFAAHGDPSAHGDYQAFLAQAAGWLDDYALFQTLRETHDGAPWWKWKPALRDREPGALAAFAATHGEDLEQQRFEEFVFDRQWSLLRAYANRHGVRLFGDMPIFVAEDSADVWAHRELFRLDADGRPQVVAGVPPDYFSATGQRWGNPHYDWERMAGDGYRWWCERLASQLRLFDLVRVDHFRGFEAFWEIPAQASTAQDGHWVAGPGAALFEALEQAHGALPLVAEDLGTITPEVHALRRAFGLPGMKVLQFAFGGGADNPYLPHNHEPDCVVYTGTHDNDTTAGWFAGLPVEAQTQVCEYLAVSPGAMPWALVRAAFASTADLAIVPMQDLLELGSEHRMNVPGITEGNWRWRLHWDLVADDTADRVRRLADLYGRIA